MPRDTAPPTTGPHGDEEHPAFGQIVAHRVSSTPGVVLFDSDIKHGHSVVVSVTKASRRRDLNRDWIHGGVRPLIEVEMSEAQWASFVSSMNTSGVPCTVRVTETDRNVPGLKYDPRLAYSMAEVKGAADKAFRGIKEALADYEQALAEKAGAKVIRDKLNRLYHSVQNTEANLSYAADSLNGYTENVVQRARADIEAMVGAEAERLGLTASQAKGLLELPAMAGEGAGVDALGPDDYLGEDDVS